MISGKQFAEMALSFPGTEQVKHFERAGFKVTGRRMFATYLEKDNTANIFLRPEVQYVFCKACPEIIFPVPNKWGLNGATTVRLDKAKKGMVMEMLNNAYDEVVKAKKK